MKHLIIRLTHCHVIQLKVEPIRLDSMLKSLEEAFTKKAAWILRDQNSAAPNVMVRGDQIIAWEVQDDFQIQTVDKLAR